MNQSKILTALFMVFLLVLMPTSISAFEPVPIEPDGQIIKKAEGNYIKLGMLPEKCINVTVKTRNAGQIHKLVNIGFSSAAEYLAAVSQTTNPLDENEQVILMFDRVEGPYDKEYMAMGTVNGINKTTEMCFVPGTYEAEAYLIRTKPEHFVLERDEREYCLGVGPPLLHGSEKVKQMTGTAVGLFMALVAAGGAIGAALGAVVFLYTNVLGKCAGETEKVVINETDLGDTLITGGFKIPDLEITTQMLNSKLVTFYALSQPDPTIIEELALITAYEDLSNDYPWLIQPTMSN